MSLAKRRAKIPPRTLRTRRAAIVKLQQLMIFVPDLPAAKRFYCRVLGFGLGSETKNSLVFTGAGCELVVYKCAQPAVPRNYAAKAQSVLVFEVSNLEESLEHLRSHKVTILHSTPGKNGAGRYAAFVDPFGIVHEIFEPKGNLCFSRDSQNRAVNRTSRRPV